MRSGLGQRHDDRAGRRAARDEFDHGNPNARAEVIEGAHHAILLSCPDNVEQLMRAFLLAPADSAR